MGYKKAATHHRDEISGLHVHDDVQDGEHSVNELRARNDARQAGINDATKADWSDPNTVNSPTYGNAMSRMPKPSDAVVGSLDTYGGGQTAAHKVGGPTQRNQPPVKGIQPATKSRG
jgi:hypothetical protein